MLGFFFANKMGCHQDGSVDIVYPCESRTSSELNTKKTLAEMLGFFFQIKWVATKRVVWI